MIKVLSRKIKIETLTGEELINTESYFLNMVYDLEKKPFHRNLKSDRYILELGPYRIIEVDNK